MPISIGSGSAYKAAETISVGSGGAWKKAVAVSIGVDGEWKNCLAQYSAGTAGTYADNDPFASGTAAVQLQLSANGTATIKSTSPGTGTLLSWNWIEPTAAASGSYSVRCNTTAGTPSTGTANTDLALSSTRSFSVQSTGASKSWSFTLQIKQGSTVLDSASYTITADAQGD